MHHMVVAVYVWVSRMCVRVRLCGWVRARACDVRRLILLAPDAAAAVAYSSTDMELRELCNVGICGYCTVYGLPVT